MWPSCELKRYPRCEGGGLGDKKKYAGWLMMKMACFVVKPRGTSRADVKRMFLMKTHNGQTLTPAEIQAIFPYILYCLIF